MKDLARHIRDVPDFPKKGIVFKDITPLLANPDAFARAVAALAAPFEGRGIAKVVAAEARGFVFGAGVALRLGAGFVPARKPKKLPWKYREASFELEYGTDSLAIHTDAISPGERVLLVDDLIATGGTIAAVARLVEEAGGKVAGCAFVIELSFLKGRERLGGYEVHSLIKYDAP
ncbi:MAG: adenine phosphoribosyltransferase [Planctomycetota bacterium]|nr:adenine phosphoribosyltransferase [Planctomycetota bacterium]